MELPLGIEGLHSQGHGQEELDPGTDKYGSLFEENSWWYRCYIRMKSLKEDEYGDHETTSDQASIHFRRAPGFRYATPLKGQEETYDATYEECGTERICLLDFVGEGKFICCSLRIVEDDGDERQCQATEREIDLEQ